MESALPLPKQSSTIPWNWRQYSLKSLFVLIVLSAVAMASLRSASSVWNATALTAVIAALSIAVTVALLRRPEFQPFWIGFTTVGWLYSAMIFGPWFSEHVGRRLVTVQLVNKLADWIEPWWRDKNERIAVAQMGGMGRVQRGDPLRWGMFPGSDDARSLSNARNDDADDWQENFYRICHFWSVLVIAWIAGASSRFACRLGENLMSRTPLGGPR
jgi:hypothetical protein